jgi:hypothetical protein
MKFWNILISLVFFSILFLFSTVSTTEAQSPLDPNYCSFSISPTNISQDAGTQVTISNIKMGGNPVGDQVGGNNVNAFYIRVSETGQTKDIDVVNSSANIFLQYDNDGALMFNQGLNTLELVRKCGIGGSGAGCSHQTVCRSTQKVNVALDRCSITGNVTNNTIDGNFTLGINADLSQLRQDEVYRVKLNNSDIIDDFGGNNGTLQQSFDIPKDSGVAGSTYSLSLVRIERVPGSASLGKETEVCANQVFFNPDAPINDGSNTYSATDPLNNDEFVFSNLCDRAGVLKDQCASSCNIETETWTAIGCIPKDARGITLKFVQLATTLAGGFALILILLGSFSIATSASNPEKLKNGQEIITAAVAGLLFIIFSVAILHFIGFEILKVPQFG